MTDNVTGIIEFNRERNLLSFNLDTEVAMLMEEIRELEESKTIYETVDALNDIQVLAIGGLFKLGYNPNLTLAETIKEIRSRKGSINTTTGKWEKDRNQDPTTLYTADYSDCKLA
jgi:hypothetical protein